VFRASPPFAAAPAVVDGRVKPGHDGAILHTQMRLPRREMESVP
jgi:hypothetical protein